MTAKNSRLTGLGSDLFDMALSDAGGLPLAQSNAVTGSSGVNNLLALSNTKIDLSNSIIYQTGSVSAVPLGGIVVGSVGPNPFASAVNIKPVSGDNFINASEANGDTVINGTCVNTFSMTLTIDSLSLPVTVISGANSTWTCTLSAANVIALGEGAHTVTVTGSGSKGIQSVPRSLSFIIDTVVPTVTVTHSDAAEVANLATITNQDLVYTYTFSESVSGMSSSSFTAVNGTVGTVGVSGGGNSTSGSVWLVTVAPNTGVASGNISLTLNAGGAHDKAGNPNAALSSTDQSIDTLAPTVTVTDSVLPGAANLATISAHNLVYTYTFSEAVSGLSSTSFTAVNGVVGQVGVSDGSSSGSVWLVTVAPNAGVASGNISLTLNAATVSDAAGNLNAVSTSADQSIDTVAPTLVTVTDSVLPNLANLATISNHNLVYTYTFSEAVSGLSSASFTTVNGVLGTVGVSGGGSSGSVWLVTVAPNAGVASGAISLTLNPATVSDLAGNLNAASVTSSDQGLDTLAPTVVVTDNLLPGVVNLATISSQTLVYTYTFSEAVSGLSSGSFTAVNGVVGTVGVSGGGSSGSVWLVTVAPNAGVASGAISLTLNPATVSDLAGNPNAASTSADQSIDTLAPTVVTVTDSVLSGAVNLATISAHNLVYIYIFSEAVSGLSSTSFTAVNGVVGTVRAAGGGSRGRVWRVTVAPNADVASGAISLTLNAATISDLAGNPNAASTSADQSIDTLAPTLVTVTDSVLSGAANLATISNHNLVYSYTFSETVSGLSSASFTAVNGVVGTVGVSGGGSSGSVWLVTVAPNAGVVSGTISLTLKAGAVSDTAGNPNAASTSADQSIDTLAPTVLTVSDSVLPGVANLATISNHNLVYSYTFSEAVSGLSSGSFTAVNGVVGTVGVAGGGSSGSVWLVTVAPNAGVASGTISLTLKAGAVSDTAGNPNAVSTSASQSIDTLAPSVSLAMSSAGASINLVSSTASAGVASLTAELNATVLVTLTGSHAATPVIHTMTGTGAAQAVTLSTAEVAQLGQGALSIAAVGYDAALNPATANTLSVNLKTTAPILLMSASGYDPVVSGVAMVNSGEIVNGMVVPGHSVMGVMAEMNATYVLTLTGSAHKALVRTITGTGAEQSVMLTRGDVSTLGQGAVSATVTETDVAGNLAQAATPVIFTLDTLAPSVSVKDNVPGIANANVNRMVYTYSFSEMVTDLAVASFSATNGAVVGVSPNSASTVYQVTVAPQSNVASGNISLLLLAGGAHDPAGNPVAASLNTAQTLDSVAPLLTVGLTGTAGVAPLSTPQALAGVLSVTTESGASVSVTLTGGTGLAGQVIKQYIDNGSAHTVTLTSGDLARLGQGVVHVLTTATDAAGNTTSQGAGGNTYLTTKSNPSVVGTQSMVNTYQLDGTKNQAVVEFDMLQIDNWQVGELFYVYLNKQLVFSFLPEQALSPPYSPNLIAGGVDGATGSTAVAGLGAVSWVVTSAGSSSNLAGASAVADRSYHVKMLVNPLSPSSMTALMLGLGGNFNASTVSQSVGIDNVVVSSQNAGVAASAKVVGSDNFETDTGTWTSSNTSVTTAAYASTDNDRAFILNTAGPAVTITSVVKDNFINQSSFTTPMVVSGTVASGCAVALTIGNQSFKTASDGATGWRYTLSQNDVAHIGQGQFSVTAVATDLLGNPGSATSTVSIHSTVPTPKVSNDLKGIANANNNGIVYTYQFNEEVTGLTAASFQVSSGNGSVLHMSGSGSLYHVTVVPGINIAGGNITLQLLANQGQDAFGNMVYASANAAVQIDTVAPDLTVTSIAPDATAASASTTGVMTVAAETGAKVSVTFISASGSVTLPSYVALDSAAHPVTLTAKQVQTLGAGEINSVVTATDAALNVSRIGGDGNYFLAPTSASLAAHIGLSKTFTLSTLAGINQAEINVDLVKLDSWTAGTQFHISLNGVEVFTFAPVIGNVGSDSTVGTFVLAGTQGGTYSITSSGTDSELAWYDTPTDRIYHLQLFINAPQSKLTFNVNVPDLAFVPFFGFGVDNMVVVSRNTVKKTVAPVASDTFEDAFDGWSTGGLNFYGPTNYGHPFVLKSLPAGSVRSSNPDTTGPAMLMHSTMPVVNASVAAAGAVSFVAEAGALVALTYVSSRSTFTLTTTATGNLQQMPLSEMALLKLGQGAVHVTADASDAAGNHTQLSSGADFSLDWVAPSATSSTLHVTGSHVMGLGDFGLASAGKDLSAVQIDHTVGMQLNGVALTAATVVSVAQIVAGELIWQAAGSAASQVTNYHLIDSIGNVSSTGAALTLTSKAAPLSTDGRILEPDLNFAMVDGSNGFDVLQFTTPSMAINLPSLIGKIVNIEAIALGAASEALTVSYASVLAMTGSGILYVSQSDSSATASADTVTFAEGMGTGASQWHVIYGANGTTLYQYFDAANHATLAKVML